MHLRSAVRELFGALFILTAVASAGAEDITSIVSVRTHKEKEVWSDPRMVVTTTVAVKIKNDSRKEILLPLHAAFDVSDPRITMPDALGGDGTGLYGKYYYDLSSRVSKGVLKPGGSVKFSAVFVRSRNTKLKYNISVFGTLSGSANVLPAIDAFTATPNNGIAPLAVFLAATAHDTDGTIVSYAFDFGDGSAGQTGASASADHTYTSAGNYTARVTVTDNRGGTASKTAAVTVTAPNVQPAVDTFTADPSSGDYPLFVNFAATAHDTDGTIVSYAFDFGDGSAGQTGASASADHTYTSAGNYTARVTVTDNRGGTASKTAAVTVTAPNVQPAVDTFTADPSSGDYPLFVNFAATAHDTDGTIVSYAFDFGDGSAGQTGASASADHTYTSAGNYTASVTATDNRGGTASKTAAVTVTAPNVQPAVDTFTADPSSGDYPLFVNFAATAHDTDGTIVSYAFDFGDGSAGQTGASASADHTYTSAGNYTASVTVTDNRGDMASKATAVAVTEPAQDSDPVISNVVAPASIAFGGNAAVTFDYADAESDVASLEVITRNAFGESLLSIPAESLGISGSSGTVSLALHANELILGSNDFVLHLRDARDALSDPASFAVALTGAASGGTSPQILNLKPQTSTWNKPVGADDRLRPQFTYDYVDPDADIERMRIRVVKPSTEETITESSAAIRGISGTGGSVVDRFVTIRNLDDLGTYTIQLSLIDRNGNISGVAAATLDLADEGGISPLAIAGFTPDGGPAGTVVTVTGSGFDADTPDNNRVTITSIPIEISEVAPTSFKFAVPKGAGTGRIVVRNGGGTAFSSSAFTIPAAVIVTPQASSVILGGTQQFAATVVSSYETEVSWSVDGLAGGNATVGTITPQGLYQAPEEMPSAEAVTVTATLISNPSVIGQTSLAMLAPPLTPGQASVLASKGGVVRSADRTAMVDIPAGALQASSNISVQALRGAAPPAAPAGKRIIGSIELGPSGLAFNSPVTITIPLIRYFVPGTHLPLYLWNSGTGSYESQGMATVLDNGEQAAAAVSHFSTYSMLDPSIACSEAPSPSITAMTASLALEEGRRVPVRISGTNLGNLLTARIRFDNADTGDVIPRTLYGLGSHAGLLLDIQPILDLPSGGMRTYTLRLEVEGCGLYADHDFSVAGLDELVVNPFETQIINAPLNPDPLRFSMVDIAGTVRVNSGTFDIESTGPVNISGGIDASGDRLSVDADGKVCGGVDSSVSNPDELCGLRQGNDTGLGGLGREDNGCSRGDDGFDCAEIENFGAGGNEASGTFGLGGTPGRNVSGDTVFNMVSDIVTCATGGSGCSSLVQDAIELVEEVVDIAEGGPLGRPGVGGNVGAAGGGGGGGGCASLAGCSLFGATIGFPGGGGGVGGARGYNISVLSGDSMQLNGIVTAEGGRGGNGSSSSADLMGLQLLSGFSGAGGGGGGGGRIRMEAGAEIYRGPGGNVSSAGGQGGAGGTTALANGMFVLFRAGRGGNGRAGRTTLSDPSNGYVFDPASIDNMVTNRSLMSIRINAPGADPVHVRVEDESGQAKVYEANSSGAGTPHTANILFSNGFNTVCITHPSDTCSGPSALHPLLQKRVLSAFTDSDNDSISDADEVAIGINPNNADTDGDGLQDGNEIQLGTNPNNADTDGDGLDDGLEVARGRTSPTNSDSDGDGTPDGQDFNLTQVTDGLSSKPPGAISHDGNKIVYGSCQGEVNCFYNNHIGFFLKDTIANTGADLFGSLPSETIPANLSAPSMAADASALVFSGFDSQILGIKDIFHFDIASGTLRPMFLSYPPAGNTPQTVFSVPVISPDGSRIAFWANWETDRNVPDPVSGGTGEKVFVMNPANGSYEQLDFGTSEIRDVGTYANASPRLSVDGAHIAVNPVNHASGLNTSLIDVNYAGTPPAVTVTRIWPFDVPDPNPPYPSVLDEEMTGITDVSINGDGTRVAFWSHNNLPSSLPVSYNPVLGFLDRTNNSYVQITQDGTCNPATYDYGFLGNSYSPPSISADGTRIAFVYCGNPNGDNGDASPELFIYETTSATFHQVTSIPGIAFGTPGIDYGIETIRNPQISGDGSRIIFESNSPTLQGPPTSYGYRMHLFEATIPF